MLNYMAYLRGSRFDYEEWKEEGCVGWGYEDVLPYYLKSENIQVPDLSNSSTLTKFY